MNYGHAFAIAGKDMKEAFASVAIYGPMLGIPLFFAFVLPAFTVYISQYAGPQLASRIFGAAAVSAPLQEKGLLFIRFFALNVLGPIFLTMPIITASVLAADSFAGEKERKTAESLLATPVTNSELFFGKILASMLPAFVLTMLVFIIYATVTNYFTLKTFGSAIFPNIDWYMMLLNAPLLSLTTIGLVVLVSSRVKGIKEAQQISALLALPVFLMPFGVILNIATLSPVFFVYMLAFLALACAAILKAGILFFNREDFISA